MQDSNSKSQIQNRSLLKTLIVFTFIIAAITGAYLYNQKQENNTNSSNNSDQLGQKISGPTTVFYTKTVPIREKTQVRIKYIPPTGHSRIWLETGKKDNEPSVKVMVYHKQLNDLDYPVVQNDDYSLFQKEKLYNSVEDFIKNPPNTGKILLGPVVYNNKVIDTQKDNVEIMPNHIPEDVDYILTTFHKPYVEGNHFVFDRIMDTTNVSITNGEITWYLNAPGANEENPFYLNGVEVNFRQPYNIN